MKDTRKHHKSQFNQSISTNQKLRWIISTEANETRSTTKDCQFFFESGIPRMKQNAISTRKRNMRQTNLWRYFRRKPETRDQVMSIKEHCMQETTNQIHGEATSIPSSDLHQGLLAALHSLCLK